MMNESPKVTVSLTKSVSRVETALLCEASGLLRVVRPFFLLDVLPSANSPTLAKYASTRFTKTMGAPGKIHNAFFRV